MASHRRSPDARPEGRGGLALLLLAVVIADLGGCSADEGAATSSAAPAPPRQAASKPDRAETFECNQEGDRGVERVVEVSRTDNSSVIRIETNFFGGATGAVMFGMSCLGRLSEERGFPYYVILDSGAVRYGTLQFPGNDWEATIGFLSAADQDIATAFGTAADPARQYRVWQATTRPMFTPALISSDVWDLFSSPHFRHRSPGEPSLDEQPPEFWAEKADEAERRLSGATVERRSGFLGDAAKSAAMAGRLDLAEGWGRELLSQAEPSAASYGQALHDSHTALGLVAIHRNDLDGARIHLLKSGMTTGSPVLGSFGPNMSLARELIEAGDRDVVLQYFDLCRGFWESGDEQLDQWEQEVQAGGLPAFGANLLY